MADRGMRTHVSFLGFIAEADADYQLVVAAEVADFKRGGEDAGDGHAVP